MRIFILASTSKIRARILKDAGIFIERIVDSGVEESVVKKKLITRNARDIALHLSKRKALAVSYMYENSYVIACDQTLCLEGVVFHKPKSKEAVKNHLLALAGKTHTLHSGISVARGGEILWSECVDAHMTVRPLSEPFIDWYVNMFGDKVKSSVGGYHFEKEGIQLFEKVDGEYFSILGLPLLQLLNFFHSRKILNK